MQKNKLNLHIYGIHLLNPYKTVVSHLKALHGSLNTVLTFKSIPINSLNYYHLEEVIAFFLLMKYQKVGKDIN